MRKFLLLLALSAFASCNKDSDNNCSLSEANLTGSYKLTSVTYKPSATSSEVNYIDSIFEACEKDDIITLNSDHTYNYIDAGTACSPTGNDSGTWSLNGNVLSVDGGPSPIENFNCSSFSGSQSDFLITGDKITFSYTKQ